MVVSHAAVICLVTQRSSPLTAAETWITFLAHCVCDKFSEPIMRQQNENDVSFRAKKAGGFRFTCARHPSSELNFPWCYGGSVKLQKKS